MPCCLQRDEADDDELEYFRNKYPGSKITSIKIRLGCDEDEEDCADSPTDEPSHLQLPSGNSSDVWVLDTPCADGSDGDKVLCEQNKVLPPPASDTQSMSITMGKDGAC